MRITPIEVQQHQFKTRWFGYDTAAVDHFLELLADELESLTKQNHELKEAQARIQTVVDHLRGREKALQDTLVTAQQVTEDLKINARKEAELLVADAHIEAERIIRESVVQHMQIINEIQDLKRQKISFECGFRALVESHLKLLDMNVRQIEEGTQLTTMLDQPLTADEIKRRLDLP
jgi:cell division initiation protein